MPLTGMPMWVSSRYGTHLPVLLRAYRRTRGPVLELGVGAFSTPLLHWLCELDGRELLSCENDRQYAGWASHYRSPTHTVLRVTDWDQAPLDRPWDVVLVDHSPEARRVVDLLRLKDLARFLVVHDTNGRWESRFRFSAAWPQFKYLWTFRAQVPNATVVSNFEPVEDFAWA